MIHINPDDPKWTAYIFGELDEAERAAVELELEISEEARMLVEELRFAADLTKSELREAVTVTPLTPQQRQEIRESATVGRGPRAVIDRAYKRWFGVRIPIWASGIAAAGVAVIVLAVALAPLRQNKLSVMAPPLDVRSAAITAEAPQAPATVPDPINPTTAANGFGLRYEHPAAPITQALADVADKTADEARETQMAAAKTEAANISAIVSGIPAAAPVPAAIPTDLAARNVLPATTRVFGSVQDAAAAVIPGVEITATNTQTGTTTKTVTNESGAYVLDGLQPGNYKLTGSLPGFQTLTADGIQVEQNAQTKRDMTLQVGRVERSIEVTVADMALSSTRTDGEISAPGQVRRQAFAAAPPPPPPVVSSRAPGVPAEFDRVRRRPPNDAESYAAITDNPFVTVTQNPLSTFSIDVDTASYSNVRRFLNDNQMPPRDAVRIEEMINYFAYDYPQPAGNNPIGASIEAAAAPWNPQHRLVRVGIKARDIEARNRPASNLVFLLDVSGSMQPAERLPLLKTGLRMFVEQLTANDRVTVVTYAGTTGVALPPTRGDQKDTILRLIDSLQAGGSTNGASGIQLAYEQAAIQFIRNGVNRVILATDGDFNVGITNRNALLSLIEDKAKSGVFLSVLGVGMGNYKDATLEMLADKGNGNYAYIDTLNEARKVLVDQMSATMVTMAKDVKVQVEFNPAVVNAYRLIGYENRALQDQDFNNDLKDAGDMGAGHTVTVLYEVVPRGVAINAGGVDPLKYQQQQPAPAPPRNTSNETLTVKVRYKEPSGSDSKLLEFPLVDREQAFARSSVDLRFAAAVASFGMILRDSPYKGTSTIDSVLSIAEDALGPDRNGYRREFLQLVQRARQFRR